MRRKIVVIKIKVSLLERQIFLDENLKKPFRNLKMKEVNWSFQIVLIFSPFQSRTC